MTASPSIAEPVSRESENLLADLVEEITNRLQAGEVLDPDAYIAAHSEHAEQLRQLFPALHVLRELSGSAAARSAPAAAPEDAAVGGTLGDFRIVREVGRGGMGVVYEAEQMSLRRRVALKVLPFAGALDARQLQRFKNESQAAAQLHHTNIVPVFAVGCERGVHFYAMQFIEGHSLADAIARLRASGGRQGPEERHPDATTAYQGNDAFRSLAVDTPPVAALSSVRSANDAAYFRTVAELGIQAALALDYAHQQSIVHRDVKPANLMLDAAGRLWVTDFGLAQIQSDTRLTMTGDLLGTLRYMSPEQALAKRVVVDHRTDVYSLGATLYEMLTLEPVFGGADRQELLRQIAFEEPRPPRRLNQAIPEELELIALKSLEKNPAERYATAQELADDLDRFLAHKPIRAKRPSLIERLRKWGRRHKPLVRASLAMFLLAVVGLAAGTVILWRANERTLGALGQAETARDSEAEARDAEARRHQQARHAVDVMWTQVAEQWLADEPHLEDVQRRFLEDALRFYQSELAEDATNPAVRQQTANAYRRVGDVQTKLGRPKQAQEAYQSAINLLAALAENPRAAPDSREDLARSFAGLAVLRGKAFQFREAEKPCRQALAVQEALANEYPTVIGYQETLARLHGNLGGVLSQDGARLHAAEASLNQARTIMEKLIARSPEEARYQTRLAGLWSDLALVRVRQGRPDQARPLVEQAIAHSRAALKTNPRNTLARMFLSNHYSLLSRDVLRPLKEHENALQAGREAEQFAQRLVEDFPRVPFYQNLLADRCAGLGEILFDLGRFGEAEPLFRQAIKHQHVTAAVPEVRSKLAKLLYFTGRYQGAAAELRQVLTVHPQDFAAKSNLAWMLVVPSDAPPSDFAEATALAQECADHDPESAACWRTLGVAIYRTGDHARAIETLKKSLDVQKAPDAVTGLVLAMALWHRGDKRESRRLYDWSAHWLDRNPTQDDWRRLCAEAAQLLGIPDAAAVEMIPAPSEAKE